MSVYIENLHFDSHHPTHVSRGVCLTGLTCRLVTTHEDLMDEYYKGMAIQTQGQVRLRVRSGPHGFI